MTAATKNVRYLFNFIIIASLFFTSFSPIPVIASPQVSIVQKNNIREKSSITKPIAQYFNPPTYKSISATNPKLNKSQSDLPPKQTTPDIEFSISTDRDIVELSKPFIVTVEIQNNSNDQIYNLQYSDELEPGVEFVPSVTDLVSYDSKKKVVSYISGIIGSGEVFSFTYKIKITDSNSSNLFIHTATLKRSNGGKSISAVTTFTTSTNRLSDQSRIDLANPDGGWNSLGDVSVYTESGEISQPSLLSATSITNKKKGPQKQYLLEIFGTGSVSRDSSGELTKQKTTLLNKRNIEFTQPAFIQFKFDDVINLRDIPAGQEPYVAVYDDASEIW
jgi:uncharacterized repeat protein (TIGR01451 family)